MDQSKLMEMQVQMRQNNADLHSFIQGLDSWEEDMKKKEEDMMKEPVADDKQELPPVRNSLQRKKKKKKQKPKPATQEDDAKNQSKRISGFDFKAWDKFNVDKALEEIDGEPDKSSSEYETDEEWEIERQVQQANVLKDEGNLYFKQKKFDRAIECYTKAIECDPTNAILPANRAMALLKQEKFGAAEIDCTTSIVVDPTYVKAYSRRATARVGLGRLEDALRDFEKVLVLEPDNKFAKAEKEKLQKKLAPPVEITPDQPKDKPVIDSDTGTLKAVYKPPSERSKKPLRRIKIEEVGLDGGQSIRQAIAKTESTQSEAKKNITQKDSAMFEQFVTEQSDTFKSPTSEEPSLQSSEVARGVSANDNSGVTDHNKLDLSDLTSEKDSGKADGKSRPQQQQNHSSPCSSPRVPAVPTTSFQFQADWKAIKKNPETVFQYLKAIDPTHYVTLFGQALDADILNLILPTLQDFYVSNKLDVYPVLENLTRVKRFSMTAMFMSSKEKAVLRKLFHSLREAKAQTEEEIKKLEKAYEL